MTANCLELKFEYRIEHYVLNKKEKKKERRRSNTLSENWVNDEMPPTNPIYRPSEQRVITVPL